MLIVDFESRSRCDLTKKGAFNYALDPSTSLLCCGFIDVDSDRSFLWTPTQELPRWLVELINTTDYVAAHNAQFDQLLWELIAENEHNFPIVDRWRWYCTSAQCRLNNLPASLEDAARALDARHKKDTGGKALIKQLCIPQKDGTFNNDPAALLKLYDYCMQDIRTTKALVEATRKMSEQEHRDWIINEQINDLGVLIDVDLAQAAQDYANDEYIEIADALHKESGGAITKHTQSVRAAKWVFDRLGAQHPAIPYITKYVDGEPKITLDKNARADILDAVDSGELDIPDDVYNVILILDEGSQSSVSKFKNMLLRADEDDHRIRGAFIYCGASQSTRYSSRGLQMHNLPQRGGFKTDEEADAVYNRLMTGARLDDPVMPQLKNMLRYAIKAREDHSLVIGDWKGIEARMLPWLVDRRDATAKLNMIADGIDIYQVTADRIGYGHRRDVGKVMELACGYGGAVGAFKQFARAYGIEPMPDVEIAELVWAWRELNPWAVNFWSDLETAARLTLKKPDQIYKVGRLGFLYSSGLMGGSLLMILPDGSVITYPQVRIEENGALTALKASRKMAAHAKEWPREQIYGGRLAGHGTQGSAAALLRNLLRTLGKLGRCVIAHVHDEVILEVRDTLAERIREALKENMCQAPDWAFDLPLDAEPILSKRYKK